MQAPPERITCILTKNTPEEKRAEARLFKANILKYTKWEADYRIRVINEAIQSIAVLTIKKEK